MSIRLFILLVFLQICAGTYSQSFSIDGMTYTIHEGNNVSVRNDTNYVSNYKLKKLVIPDFVKYGDMVYTVSRIEDGGFCNMKSLEYLQIASNVKNIGKKAFQGCIRLRKVKIPEFVASIGFQAFANCERLSHVELNDNLQRIEDDVWSGCNSLRRIRIPASVSDITGNPFSGCDALAHIVVDKDNAKYDSRNGCDAIIKTETNEVIAGCNHTRFPKSVTGIGFCAFNRLTGIKRVRIPQNIIHIAEGAFYMCSSVERISVSSKNRIYNSDLGCNAIVESNNGKLISGCRNTVFTSNIREIGQLALCGVYNNQILRLPKNIVSIGNSAFAFCNKIQYLYIPANTSSIYQHAFYKCKGLKSVIIEGQVKDVPQGAFYGCENLAHVTLPACIEHIDHISFAFCSNLHYIGIPEKTDITTTAFSDSPTTIYETR